jgi:hypothetical protein
MAAYLSVAAHQGPRLFFEYARAGDLPFVVNTYRQPTKRGTAFMTAIAALLNATSCDLISLHALTRQATAAPTPPRFLGGGR